MEFMRGKKSDHEVANCVCPPAQPKDDADNGDIKVTRFRTLIPPYQEKKINALMLLGCVHNWFSISLASTSTNWCCVQTVGTR